jgi:hypothetical protein
MKRIADVAELKSLIDSGHTDYAIALCGGALLSRKNIAPSQAGRYSVFHGIDGRFEELSERELLDDTNIGAALEAGIFVLDE